jgi:hypothetical protein
VIVLPFAAAMRLGAISLGTAPRAHWHDIVTGDRRLACNLSIPLISVVPFAVIGLAVRQTGPTNPGHARARARLMAGAPSATRHRR